mmetsp:Transcript_21214/g.32873  ORF Transcript_21214/g.32873 Transcript_21214/m.32873 type:complete len:80 (+) Transcript_21214:1243-1482(+)
MSVFFSDTWDTLLVVRRLGVPSVPFLGSTKFTLAFGISAGGLFELAGVLYSGSLKFLDFFTDSDGGSGFVFCCDHLCLS